MLKFIFKLTDKLSVLISIAGVALYYFGIYSVLYFCAAFLIVHSILNCVYGGQNNLVTEVLTYLVGALISLIFKLNFWPCISVAFCFAEMLFSLPGIILLFSLLFSSGKERKNDDE